MQSKSACAGAASEHSTSSRGNRIDESSEIWCSSAKQKASRNLQKVVGVTAAALPKVLRKQRPKRRGVGEAVQRSSSNVRKRKSSRDAEVALGLEPCATESREKNA